MIKIRTSCSKEKYYWSDGFSVIGVDEVGRGCLAGPVVAGAVCFNKDHKLIRGVTDSKLLSLKKRLAFSDQIKKRCQQCAVGVSSVDEINTLGIVPATFLAMERALLQFTKVEVVLIDGSLTPLFKKLKTQLIETIIKGDQLSYSIAAASIVAKVYRDELMQNLNQRFPVFAWDQNKGYGTQQHREALLKHGLTPHHRSLFCRNVFKSE